jgi:hypothetical protein
MDERSVKVAELFHEAAETHHRVVRITELRWEDHYARRCELSSAGGLPTAVAAGKMSRSPCRPRSEVSDGLRPALRRQRHGLPG